MKLKFLALFICFNIFNTSAQSTAEDTDDTPKEMTLKEALNDKYIYWENGAPNEVIAVVKNSSNDYYEGFFKNGTLAVKGVKKDQKKIGKWNYYYKNAKRKESVRFDQDGKWLVSKKYDENGALRLEKNRVDKSNTDYYEIENKYFEKGKLIAKGNTYDDYREGEWEFYNDDGELIRTILYKEDEVVFENKKKKMEVRVSYKAKLESSAFGGAYAEKMERGWESSLWFPYDSYEEYDLKGNLIKRTYRKSNHEIHQTYDFEYDNKSNRVKETIYWRKYDRYSNYEYEYEYDSHDNILEKYTTENDEYKEKRTYRYDSSGNIIEEVTYLSDDEYNYSNKEINTYNSHNNLITSIRNFADGKIYKTIYTYDSRNNLTKKVLEGSNSNGSIYAAIVSNTTDTTTYIYDAKNNLIKEVAFSQNDLVKLVLEYQYDYDGDRDDLDYGNKTEFKKTRYYKGKLTDLKRYEYRYDYENNELFKTVVYIDDEPAFIIEREIIYYGDDY